MLRKLYPVALLTLVSVLVGCGVETPATKTFMGVLTDYSQKASEDGNQVMMSFQNGVTIIAKANELYAPETGKKYVITYNETCDGYVLTDLKTDDEYAKTVYDNVTGESKIVHQPVYRVSRSQDEQTRRIEFLKGEVIGQNTDGTMYINRMAFDELAAISPDDATPTKLGEYIKAYKAAHPDAKETTAEPTETTETETTETETTEKVSPANEQGNTNQDPPLIGEDMD